MTTPPTILVPPEEQARLLFEQGTAHHRAGRLDDAAECYGQALDILPDHAGALANLGLIRLGWGQGDEAVRCLRRAAAAAPARADLRTNLGAALLSLGRLDEAEPVLRQAIALAPADPAAYINVARVLAQTGRAAEAVPLATQAIALSPHLPDAHAVQGLALAALGQADAALDALNRALALSPDRPATLVDRGNLLQDLDRPAEAVDSYRRALALRPDLAEAWSNLGNALMRVDQPDDALDAHRRALAQAPGKAVLHDNLGVALLALGRIGEAEHACRQALALAPDLPTAHYNLGLILLLTGRLREGWPEYGWRLRGALPPALAPATPAPTAPEWQGEPLAGRTLLLVAEQGLGDTLLFCRYAPVLAETGRILLEAPPDLAPLLSSLGGVAAILPQGMPRPPHDLYCLLGQVPERLDSTLATLPTPPYLTVPAEARARWTERLPPRADRLTVGLVWAGNPRHANDRKRSLPFERLAPLWAAPRLRLVSLQTGARGADLTLAPAGAILDLAPALSDFVETAAALERVDLLITVDTAAAHLAGALGRPAWVLLPAVPDWRWLLERADSPWYPTLRLFRQTRAGDWDGVVDRVAAALGDFTARTAAKS